jgi:hypothetical protein
MMPLPSVRSGLLCNCLDDQVLVYDPRAERVHLLDPSTACVMELLGESRWTIEGITAEVSRRTNLPPNPDLLLLAIEELRKADLLDTDEGIPPELPGAGMLRREMLRKAALGATALIIPAIVSLAPSTAYGQTSGCFPVNSCCVVNGDCCPGTVCVSDPGRCPGTGKACHFGP